MILQRNLMPQKLNKITVEGLIKRLQSVYQTAYQKALTQALKSNPVLTGYNRYSNQIAVGGVFRTLQSIAAESVDKKIPTAYWLGALNTISSLNTFQNSIRGIPCTFKGKNSAIEAILARKNNTTEDLTLLLRFSTQQDRQEIIFRRIPSLFEKGLIRITSSASLAELLQVLTFLSGSYLIPSILDHIKRIDFLKELKTHIKPIPVHSDSIASDIELAIDNQLNHIHEVYSPAIAEFIRDSKKVDRHALQIAVQSLSLDDFISLLQHYVDPSQSRVICHLQSLYTLETVQEKLAYDAPHASIVQSVIIVSQLRVLKDYVPTKACKRSFASTVSDTPEQGIQEPEQKKPCRKKLPDAQLPLGDATHVTIQSLGQPTSVPCLKGPQEASRMFNNALRIFNVPENSQSTTNEQRESLELKCPSFPRVK